MIDTPEQFAQLCADLPDAGFIVMDTEFVRVRTYFPVLCLIQINDGRRIHCVDTVGLQDIAPLMAAFDANPGPLVLHSGRQDFETLYLRSARLPRAIWDTQIAAAMCGYGEQVSYAQLVEEIAGIKLSKSQTRTNWAKRPLSANQIDYAADDVRYLPQIRDTLETKLADLDRLDWLRDECQRLLDPGLYEPDVEQAYRKCKSRRRFSPRQRGAWRALCALRERTACERDRPRRWVIDDAGIEELALLDATHTDRIASVLRQSKAHPGFTAQAVAQTLADAQPVSETRAERMDAKAQALVDQCLAIVRKIAKELNVSATLLATRRDIVRLVQRGADDGHLDGWRGEVIGAPLRQVLPATA